MLCFRSNLLAAATQVPVFTFTERLLASSAIETENPGVTAILGVGLVRTHFTLHTN